MKTVDHTGDRFGRLLVRSRSSKAGVHTMWDATCDCGAQVVVAGPNLRSGRTSSCGCLAREINRQRQAKANTTHGQSYTPAWRSWSSMLTRCLNPCSRSYASYGGNGVTVCERWKNSFAHFLADMGERPEGKTLDRWPNPAGNYEPGNCRWATPLEQRHNRRPK